MSLSYKKYISKVITDIHPDLELDEEAVNECDMLIQYIARRLISEADKLTSMSRLRTINTRAINSAIMTVLSGKIGEYASKVGADAVISYTSKAKSRSLIFPVRLTSTLIKTYAKAPRVGMTAAVFLAAVLEYVISEILSEAGLIASKDKRTVMNVRDIKLTINNDMELYALLSKVILSGGVPPNIHLVLVPRDRTHLDEI